MLEISQVALIVATLHPGDLPGVRVALERLECGQDGPGEPRIRVALDPAAEVLDVSEGGNGLDQRVVQFVRHLLHQKVTDTRQDDCVEVGVVSVGLDVGRP